MPDWRRIQASWEAPRTASFAAVENLSTDQRFGVQFHPEVTHSAARTAASALQLPGHLRLRAQLGHGRPGGTAVGRSFASRPKAARCSCWCLGGVDSTVAFALLNKALGADRVLGLHIDNGLMRAERIRGRHGLHEAAGIRQSPHRRRLGTFPESRLDGDVGTRAQAQDHRRHLPGRSGGGDRQAGTSIPKNGSWRRAPSIPTPSNPAAPRTPPPSRRTTTASPPSSS
jgi:hypothetical protein